MTTSSRTLALLGTIALLLGGAAGGAGQDKDAPAPDEPLLKVLAELTLQQPADTVRRQPCKVYPVRLKAGTTYVIDMRSTAFDSYLRLEDPDGKQVASDDDGGGLRNARIRFNCSADGVYKVITTTFNGGTGRFIMTVRERPAPLLAVTEKLTADDPKDRVRSKSHAKIHPVKLEAGKLYQIDLESTSFDTYLRLEDDTGKQLAINDDGGTGLNARLVFRCRQDGTYRIIATSYVPAATGGYTLTVQPK